MAQEKRNDFNFNLHPQQVAQSTSLSHTNGGSGTADNTNGEGVGPFSDDDGLSGF